MDIHASINCLESLKNISTDSFMISVPLSMTIRLCVVLSFAIIS